MKEKILDGSKEMGKIDSFFISLICFIIGVFITTIIFDSVRTNDCIEQCEKDCLRESNNIGVRYDGKCYCGVEYIEHKEKE